MARLAPAALYEQMKRQKFVIAGPNVIESEEHVMRMAKSAKAILGKFDVLFIFKTSFDKANRTSAESYRGVSAKEATHIFQRVRTELGIPVITDVHEPHQCKLMADCVDILQIPAFLCRQTDLIIAAAETGLVLHIKKGQFCHADALHKTVQKAATAGNELCILCERGTFFGYQDIVVDPRNFERLKSDKNLVSMDITHCLQQPAQKSSDGVVKSGGERYLIPTMGKMAFALGCHGVFLETHDRPDESLCDAPTQWPLEKLEWLLEHIGCERKPSFLAAKLVPLVRSFETLTESAAFGELCEKLSCCACTAAGPKQSAYFSGIGKSRLAAQHACELLKSIGVNAGLCPIQAGHGDIGPLRAGDITVLFSKSGRTAELLDLATSALKPRRCFVVGVCCDPNHAYAEAGVDLTIVLPFHGEMDGPNAHLPTNSVVAQILLGNALAMRLASTCSMEQYASNHPAGAIGKAVYTQLATTAGASTGRQHAVGAAGASEVAVAQHETNMDSVEKQLSDLQIRLHSSQPKKSRFSLVRRNGRE